MTRADDLLWRRWAEVDALLDAALDLPSEERTATIIRATRDDPPLRELLLRLLDRITTDQRGATAPPRDVVVSAFGTEPQEAVEPDFEPGTAVGLVRGGSPAGAGRDGDGVRGGALGRGV